MADVAEVIVKGNADFKNANASLDAFNNKASKSAKKADLLNASIGKMSDTMEMLSGDFKNVSNTLAQGFDSLGKKLDTQIQRFDRLSKSIRNAKQQHKEFSKVQKESAAMADKMSGNTTRGAAQANRFNSGNFLAQFQDIAVTSAMGMNPLLIAVQQGTQLQYILAQSKAPLKDFVAGLKSAFSMTGLLAIGLTGVVAGLIQMVDWSKVGNSMLNGLSEMFGFVADNATTFTVIITGVAAALILLNGSAITATIINLGKLSATALVAGAKMAAGWAMAAAPVTLLIGAIGGLIYVFMKFPNQIAIALNTAIDFIVGFVNKTIGLFKGLIAVIKEVPDLIKDSFKNGLNSAKELAKGTMDFYLNANYIDASGLKENVKNVVQGTSDVMNTFIDKISNAVKTTASKVSESLKTTSEGLDKTNTKLKQTKTEVDKVAQAWDNLQKSSQNKIDDLVTQRSLIGAGTYEKTYVETLSNLKREAENAGIDLYSTANGKSVYDTLNENAQATAALTEENERLNASYEFTKSTVKGFFSDMRQGLRDGQSAWETFGNAVTNVLDKILDKIMDIGVDALFTAGRGYFGTSAMGGHGLFGGLGAGTGSTGIGGLQVGQTSGNLTYLGNIAMNANGGVYSNGIYNSPRLFKFGKGGKFGLMGEDGQEASMPLTRGPDGSLGVRAENSSASPVVVNVINNSNAQAKVEQRQTSQGMEIDVMIDQLVAEKMNQPGTSSNNALRAFSNQKLIAR